MPCGVFTSLWFFVCGLVLSNIRTTIEPVFGSSVIGSFVAAWLVGLLTPGAPAGIGVREVFLLAALGHLVAESELLWLTSLARLVTMFGDLVFYLCVLISPKWHNRGTE